MKMIPMKEFTDELWYHAYKIFYDRDTNIIMGTDPALYVTPPTIVEFYEVASQKANNGILHAWLFLTPDDTPIGYVVLDKSKGEWELGIAIQDPEQRGKGYGVKAALRVLKFAFEELGVRWVTAFTQGTDLKVPKQIQRMGFEKLYHFWVMCPNIWERTWKGRIK